MNIQAPEYVVQVINDLDKSRVPLAEYEVESALIRAVSAHEPVADEDVEGFFADLVAFQFRTEKSSGKSAWGTYFRPYMVKDETEMTSLCERLARYQATETWESRAENLHHPVLKARYADLVWDIGKLITKKSPAIRYCRAAVDAYMEAVAEKLYKVSVNGVEYVMRALQLAQETNDTSRVRRIGQFALNFFDTLISEPQYLGTWPRLFDVLYKNRNAVLSPSESEKLIDAVEQLMARCANPSDPSFHHRAAQAAGARLSKHYQALKQLEEQRRVARTWGLAVEHVANTADPPAAMFVLQEVIQSYNSLGMPADAKRVQLASRAKADLLDQKSRRISVRTEIPHAQMESYLDAMTEGGLETSLDRIARHFVPNIDRVRDFLQKSEKSHFSALVPVVIVGDGHLVSQAGSFEDDPEGRLLMQLATQIDLDGPFLSESVATVRRRYSPRTEDILEFLHRSPLFKIDTDGLLEEGIEAYLSTDYIKAVHILIPQIEKALRSLAARLGVPTNRPARSPGTMQCKNLNELLREEEIKAYLGKDLSHYLLGFLADARGHNVRNLVTHGLVSANYFGESLADRLFHVFLILALVPAPESESYYKVTNLNDPDL